MASKKAPVLVNPVFDQGNFFELFFVVKVYVKVPLLCIVLKEPCPDGCAKQVAGRNPGGFRIKGIHDLFDNRLSKGGSPPAHDGKGEALFVNPAYVLAAERPPVNDEQEICKAEVCGFLCHKGKLRHITGRSRVLCIKEGHAVGGIHGNCHVVHRALHSAPGTVKIRDIRMAWLKAFVCQVLGDADTSSVVAVFNPFKHKERVLPPSNGPQEINDIFLKGPAHDKVIIIW